jgi:hypothetical protein
MRDPRNRLGHAEASNDVATTDPFFCPIMLSNSASNRQPYVSPTVR